MKKTALIILAVVIILGLWLWSSYNRLVTANEGIDGQWAQVETQYQRRFDLIPNLVGSVELVMNQEANIFLALAEARANYSGARTVDEKAAAATQVEGSFGRLLAIMENYPQIKSSENVTNLMTQLEGTENRVSVERTRFNEAVKDFNVMIKRLPTNLVAGILGFSTRTYFEAMSGAEIAPQVNPAGLQENNPVAPEIMDEAPLEQMPTY